MQSPPSCVITSSEALLIHTVLCNLCYPLVSGKHGYRRACCSSVLGRIHGMAYFWKKSRNIYDLKGCQGLKHFLCFRKPLSQINNKGCAKCHFRLQCCPLLWVTVYIMRCAIKLDRTSCGVTGFSIESWQFPFKSWVRLLIWSATQTLMLACVDVINIWISGWHKIQPGTHTK